MPNVVYAQCTYAADYDDTLACMKEAADHFDHKIVVEDGSLRPHQKRELKREGCIVLAVKFNDSLPEFRQHYIEEAKRLGADWIVVSDPDEHFNEEFLVNAHVVCSALDYQGYNMAGINCVNQFKAIDWLDDLDKLKEIPGGEESDFYKNLVYRCYPDLKVEGVGRTKNVHETWYSPTHPWKSTNLDKKYNYVHRKDALKIWRNAARNMFIGGGGDNLGDLNSMWVELRSLMKKRGINDWRSFERFVTEGNRFTLKESGWVEKALVWKATDYGTETRETAKWMVYYNRYLLGKKAVKYGLKHPPKMDERTETETFVRRLYFQVLGRHPDRPGLENYTGKILSGKLKRNELEATLRSSPEYHQKQGEQLPRITITADMGTITDAVFMSLLQQSRTWNEYFKPYYDLGKHIESIVGQDFLTDFYYLRETGKLDSKKLAELIRKHER